jgi:hypothetical protein
MSASFLKLTFIDVSLTCYDRMRFITFGRGISRHVTQQGKGGRNARLFWG